MSGKWIHRSSQSAYFFVPQFVDSKELEDILPHLPTKDISNSLRDKLQDFPPFVPRDIGKPLIRKMLDFWAASDAAYQASSSSLDKAYERVAHHSSLSYATLEEIAEKVLRPASSTAERGPFPAHVLYAVHRSLFRDEIGFRPQTKGTVRTGGQYEMSPLKEVRNVEFVRRVVRLHRENEASRGTKPIMSALGQFAITARNLVDLSRNTQSFTTYGTITTSELQNDDSLGQSNFTELRDKLSSGSADVPIIKFLKSWAAWSSFGSSSPLNGIGSEILRAIQRYGEVNLDKTTAWTFLQEIGEIAPWENRLALNLNLPRIGEKLELHSIPKFEDSLQGLRQDWGDLAVYCIDDPSAHEIDDGISIEAIPDSDEFWCHVHAADPSSYLDVGSGYAEYAEFAVENVYMPELAYSMIPKEIVQKRFSLAPGRPTMTFSARMNKNGRILDTKIVPGRIHKVQYFSPDVLQQVVLGLPSSGIQDTVRFIGKSVPSASKGSPRTMLESQELSESSRTDLLLLHEIGAAHAALLRARGGVDQIFPSKPKLSVQVRGKSGKIYDRNPTIQLSTGTESNVETNQGNLVQSFMLVAAQVAASFCKDRGIPVPYRVTPRNPAKEDPSNFFIRKVLPSRAENGVAPIKITSEYLRLIGGVLPSTTPGPHAAVGVDMMVRCTSPLRRFTDLLVHWQIGAALKEEASRGESLVGNAKDDFFPFSKARVEALLPRLDTREKLIKWGQKEADRHWLCMFLLRAWQFKETDLPPVLPFIVRRISIEERKISGMLTDFQTRAQCSVPDEMNLEEIELGEILNVELEHINVYERKIQVKVA